MLICTHSETYTQTGYERGTEKTLLKSSFVDGIVYSEKRRELTVIIRGIRYLYLNVSRRQRDNLRHSAVRLGLSIGEAYNKIIKGKYACLKLA